MSKRVRLEGHVLCLLLAVYIMHYNRYIRYIQYLMKYFVVTRLWLLVSIFLQTVKSGDNLCQFSLYETDESCCHFIID